MVPIPYLPDGQPVTRAIRRQLVLALDLVDEADLAAERGDGQAHHETILEVWTRALRAAKVAESACDAYAHRTDAPADGLIEAHACSACGDPWRWHDTPAERWASAAARLGCSGVGLAGVPGDDPDVRCGCPRLVPRDAIAHPATEFRTVPMKDGIRYNDRGEPIISESEARALDGDR